MATDMRERGRKGGQAAAAAMTPEQRVERARRASAAKESLDRYVERVVARAPELTVEQRARLRALLGPYASG